MDIKGSGNKYYSVNMQDLTCTCKDWTCRRHNFPVGDTRRICKHLKEAFDLNSYLDIENNLLESIDEDEVSRISNIMNSDNNVFRYEICSKPVKNRKCSSLIFRLFKDIDNYEGSLAYSLGYKNISDEGVYLNEDKKSYIKIERCTPSNYLFRKLFYSRSIDDLVKISSISYGKFGYKLTKDGFINESGDVVDLNIFTEEDLSELLKEDI